MAGAEERRIKMFEQADGWCAECFILVAPYADHVRFRGKIWHTHCWDAYLRRETQQNKNKLAALKKARRMRRPID